MSFAGGSSRHNDTSSTVVTYRHLLSPQAMTVYNPLRTIAHCDIDAAYAQFEAVRLGLPDDIPVIVVQWFSIIAVNYPARKYGIKRFTTLDEAKKMCPNLFAQHVATYRPGESESGYWDSVDPTTHKVSLDPYRRESLKILAIFKEMVPKGEIEKASIDEAFLDLTPMVIDRLLELHPYLATVPDDAPDGLDSPLPKAPPIDWTKAGNVFPVNGDVEDKSAGAGEDPNADGADGRSAIADEGEQHVWSSQKSDDGREFGRGGSGESDTWEDWALCIGGEIMADVRAEVWKRLHYTCTAGIAHAKAMAKLCSAWKKPNNQTVLRKSATAAFLRNMDFTDIRYLGGKLGSAIATEYGAKTVGDMLLVPLEEMQARFGEESIWVYNILRGIDHTEVKERTATKSMLASKNARPAIKSYSEGLHWIELLAGELYVRLRDSRESNPGLWPKTLVLGHRTGGYDTGKSRQIPFPFTRHLTAAYIVKYAKRLWDEVSVLFKSGFKFTNLALSLTGLEKLEGGQQGIEGFFAGSDTKVVPPSEPSDVITTVKRPRSPEPVREEKPKISQLPTSSNTTSFSPKKPRLPTLHTGPRKTALDAFLGKNGESSKMAQKRSSSPSPAPRALVDTQTIDVMVIDDDGEDQDSYGDRDEIQVPQIPDTSDRSTGNGEMEPNKHLEWRCPKCNHLFSVAADNPQRFGAVVQAGVDMVEDGDMDMERRAAKLADMKQEHEDFHFAEELQNGGSSPVNTLKRKDRERERDKEREGESGGGNKKVKKKNGKEKKKEGIKAFFAPKTKSTVKKEEPL